MTRTKHEHLTKTEIGTLRKAFLRGDTVRAASALVNCAERNVCKYFSYFRAEGLTAANSVEPHQVGPVGATTPYDHLNPWQPKPFLPAHVFPDVAHKLRRGRA